MMRHDDQILARAPEAPRRGRLPAQDRRTQALRAVAHEARVRAANRAGGVGVAATDLCPAIARARQAHRDLRGADAGEAAVECLNAIGMQLWLAQQAVHHRLLHAEPEDAVEGMRDDGETALLMDQLDAALDTQVRRDALLDEEGEHVPLAGADLLADDHLKTIVAFRRQVARAQRAGDRVVVGNRDHVEWRGVLDVLQRLFDRAGAIAIVRMHVRVGQAEMLPRDREAGLAIEWMRVDQGLQGRYTSAS